ncbi:Type IV pilus biogeneis protein PilP [Candidatus Burkholderia verschuerenii]|uniref:Type IV pilus biogeneis protein PilP n=1 Tax=Candidatus Burkholderia verschuerenii TaxID=242163 RepID=A0A0L0MFE7_9BURK|nr:type 4a pilus biogenesis protein PilO [Candidatus Burkholderia verschuerenii]KND61026.1 Type IV pilus biogeneis protein PilP [Candidatus Burkholderia verschuerenii]
MTAITMSLSAQSAFSPIETWSRRRTVVTGFGLATLVFALGATAWRASALIDVDASRSALVAARTKVTDTRRLVADLPDLRARVATVGNGRLSPGQWTSADALREIAGIAAQSGLRVTEIEPVAPERVKGAATDPQASARALRFRAEGAFGEIGRFLDALAGLPRLVVPERTQMKRQAGALSIDTILRVYETLPAVPLAAAPRADAFVVDPFGKDAAGGFARGGDLLLVGTIVGA